jgi:hypothetical protein
MQNSPENSERLHVRMNKIGYSFIMVTPKFPDASFLNEDVTWGKFCVE